MAVNNSSSHLAGAFALLLFVISSVLVLIFVNSIQNKPYMDEIFHIPQVHKYCNGVFNEWDPKITTPPGLYIVTVGLLVPISKLFNFHLCEVLHLRFVNLGFAIGNIYLFYCISKKIHQNSNGNKIMLTCVNLASFPILYFFSFLYYTDAGSTFFVLLAYLYHLYGQNIMSALFGLLSLLFRQTNIVWIFFMAGEKVVDLISTHARLEKKKSSAASRGSFQYLLQVMQFLFSLPYTQKRLLVNLIYEVLKSCIGYIAVAILFANFIILNEGLALGDRESHQICPHMPQILYFLGFVLTFSNPYLLTLPKLTKFYNWCKDNLVFFVAIMLAMSVCLRYLTFVHIYLLSDNRHYTFYIWRYFLGKDAIRYLFIPTYVYAGWSLMTLFQSKNALWKVLLLFCIILSTVPQKLLEFRYFIIPYLLIRLHSPLGSNSQIAIELILYLVINVMTIFMFLQYPYKWEGNHEVQRFMW